MLAIVHRDDDTQEPTDFGHRILTRLNVTAAAPDLYTISVDLRGANSSR
jgi:hypothetical protein